MFPQSRWETSTERWNPTPWGAGRNPPNSRAGGKGGFSHTALVPARLTEQVDMLSPRILGATEQGDKGHRREVPGSKRADQVRASLLMGSLHLKKREKKK